MSTPARIEQMHPHVTVRLAWLESLESGDYRSFDLVRQASGYPRVVGRWIRLLLLLAGDVERNPGPAPVGLGCTKVRGELDMTVGFTKPTAQRMAKCLKAFETWLEEELKVNFTSAMTTHILVILK